MEIVYVFTKRRRDYGRHCNFSESPGELLHNVLPDDGVAEEYVEKNPCSQGKSALLRVIIVVVVVVPISHAVVRLACALQRSSACPR